MVCLRCLKTVFRAAAGKCVNGDPWMDWRTEDGFDCPIGPGYRHRAVDASALTVSAS